MLGWTTDFLKRKGSESPRLDAEVMLAHALETQRVELYTHFNDEVAEPARKAFRELVQRRAAGAPVAYLVGRKEFFSLSFTVSPDVLIPRPESEFVVTEYLTATRGDRVAAVCRCRDRFGLPGHRLGAPSARGTLRCDRHQRASAGGRQRRMPPSLAWPIASTFGWVIGLEPLGGEDGFDAIIANPPYIASDEIDQLEAGVKDYEPRLALDGGPGGLVVVSRLIEDAPAHLRPGGHLILEIGSAQELPVRALIEKQPGLKLAPTVFDHAKHPRVIQAARVGQ